MRAIKYTGSLTVKCRNEKDPMDQSEDLSDEQFHEAAALIGLLALF